MNRLIILCCVWSGISLMVSSIFSNDNSSLLISKAIKEGININQKLSDGSYFLIHATKQKKPNIVRMLLENGADPNVKDDNGFTALMYSINPENYRIMKLLLEHGADINITATHSGVPVLFMTYCPKMIKLLLNYNPNLLVKDKNGITLLNTSGKNQLVNYFLDNNGDVKDIESPGTTELMRAAILNDAVTVKQILNIKGNKKEIDKKDSKGWTALMFACKYGHKEIAKLLINNKADINTSNKRLCTSLMIAVGEGYFEIVKLLIENGAKVKAKDNSGKNALHHTYDATFENNTCRIIDILLKNGIDVDSVDMTGKSLLMKAIIQSNVDFAEYLYRKGGNLDFKNSQGNTALIITIVANNYNMINFLLKHKVSVNILNVDNLTALDYALFKLSDDVPLHERKPIESNLIIQLLRKYGAKTVVELLREDKSGKVGSWIENHIFNKIFTDINSLNYKIYAQRYIPFDENIFPIDIIDKIQKDDCNKNRLRSSVSNPSYIRETIFTKGNNYVILRDYCYHGLVCYIEMFYFDDSKKNLEEIQNLLISHFKNLYIYKSKLTETEKKDMIKNMKISDDLKPKPPPEPKE